MKRVDVARYPAERQEQQVSGHQQFTCRRRLLNKSNPNADGFFRVMFETVVPVGVVETDWEDGVACESQPFAAGHHADHAVSWGMAAGARA